MSNYNDINNPNNNPNINQNPDNNFISNMTNENFINMASSINLDNLNGTNIMDLGRDTLSTINNLPSLNTISSYNNMTSLNNKSPMNNIQYFNNLSLSSIDSLTLYNHTIIPALLNHLRNILLFESFVFFT